MTCDHCVRAVERAVEGLDGVHQAKVSLNDKTAQVTFDESTVSIQAMREAIEEEGYQATERS